MWEAIESNKRKSWILLAIMGVLLVGLGFGIGAIFDPRFGIYGAVGALVLWFIMWMVAISSGDSIMLMAAGAKKIEKQDAPQLFNVVEEMTIASGGGKMPDVYIIPDDKPNAFAIGRKPERQAVAVTSGLLRILDRDELQGVMAHEIGHLKNQDTKFLVLAGVMLGTIVILSDILLYSFIFGGMGRSRSSRGGGQGQIIILVVVLLLAILAPILARILYFACSRRREYLADASSAQYTRYPEGLASALEKITGHYKGAGRKSMRQRKANRVLAPMFIINPMEAVAAVGLFSTHPPSQQRISILRSMAGGAGYREYDEAFRKVAGGQGVIGKRSLAGAKPVGKREASPPGKEKKKSAQERSHEVIQMLGRIENLIMLTCVCGVGIKVPPGLRRDTIPCPRCKHANPVPRAKEESGSNATVYRRKGKGWESVNCPCGWVIQLSPAFESSSIRCTKCNRTIEIRS